jgi:hypothetical protein
MGGIPRKKALWGPGVTMMQNARKTPISDIQVGESVEGRFVTETHGDGSIIRRLVKKDAKPRRKPRKPFARAWRPLNKPNA